MALLDKADQKPVLLRSSQWTGYHCNMPTWRGPQQHLESLDKTAANVLDVLSYKHKVQSVCWPLSCILEGLMLLYICCIIARAAESC